MQESRLITTKAHELTVINTHRCDIASMHQPIYCAKQEHIVPHLTDFYILKNVNIAHTHNEPLSI